MFNSKKVSNINKFCLAGVPRQDEMIKFELILSQLKTHIPDFVENSSSMGLHATLLAPIFLQIDPVKVIPICRYVMPFLNYSAFGANRGVIKKYNQYIVLDLNILFFKPLKDARHAWYSAFDSKNEVDVPVHVTLGTSSVSENDLSRLILNTSIFNNILFEYVFFYTYGNGKWQKVAI